MARGDVPAADPDEGWKVGRKTEYGGGTGQFCPRRAMLGAIDHAISVVRPDRMAERVDNWTPTTPEVRVMTLEGGHAKTAPRQPPTLRAFTFAVYGAGHIKRNMWRARIIHVFSLLWDLLATNQRLSFFLSSLLPFFPSYFLFFIRSTTTDRGYGFSLIYSRICLPADCERVELPARRDDSTLTYLCDRLSRSYGTILPKAALYTYTSGVSSSSCFHLEEMQLRERKFDFPFRVRCEVRCWSRDLCVSRFLGNSDEFLLCRISFDISKLSYTWLGVVASRLRQLSIVIK